MLNSGAQERIPRGLEFLKHGPETGVPSFSWNSRWAGEIVCLELFSRSDADFPPAVKLSSSFLCPLKKDEKRVTGQAPADKTSSCCDF